VEVVAHLSGKPRIGTGLASCHVERIAHQRMAGRRHVDADLVGSAGGNLDFDERTAGPLAQDSHMRDRPSSVWCRSEDLSESRMGYWADGDIDGKCASLRKTRYEGEVGLEDCALLPLTEDLAPRFR
jgi:hypothetical protein